MAAIRTAFVNALIGLHAFRVDAYAHRDCVGLSTASAFPAIQRPFALCVGKPVAQCVANVIEIDHV